jgi:opacity protein-like surface antigen
MFPRNQHTTAKRLMAASLCAAGVAFGGTYADPVAPPTTAPASGYWSWFAGGSVGYLLDYETEMYHAHLGTEYHAPSGLSHGFFLEVGYAEGLESQFATTVTGDFVPETGGPTILETGTAAFDGEVEFIPVTFNYKLEGCFTDTFKWYVGAGIGAAFVDADYSLAITGAFPAIGRRLSDDDTVFAGQIFAGVVWEATENFELYSGARWIYVDDPELSDTFTGASLDVEIDDVLIEGGFRFNF